MATADLKVNVNVDAVSFHKPSGKKYLRITPEGKLRGPLVVRVICTVAATGFLSGLLGAVAGRLL